MILSRRGRAGGSTGLPRPLGRRHEQAPSPAAMAAASAALVGYNTALNLVPLPNPLYVPANLALSGSALSRLGQRWGIGPDEVGLTREGVVPGLLLGGAVAGAAGMGLLALLGNPATEPLLHDRRVSGLAGGRLAYHTLVRVPFGTAVPEELLFRGVLLEAFAARLPRPLAMLASSAVFGLWHIGPTLRLLDANRVDAGAARTALVVAGAALAATAAGVGFCLLRRWGEGLWAPMVAHAGINALGVVAAVASQRTS